MYNHHNLLFPPSSHYTVCVYTSFFFEMCCLLFSSSHLESLLRGNPSVRTNFSVRGFSSSMRILFKINLRITTLKLKINNQIKIGINLWKKTNGPVCSRIFTHHNNAYFFFPSKSPRWGRQVQPSK